MGVNEDKTTKKHPLYSDIIGNLNFSKDENDFISIKNSITTINLSKPESPTNVNEFGDYDKLYVGENSIIKVKDFRYSLTDIKGATSYVTRDKLYFDLEGDKPYKFSYFILDNDLYVFATDDNNESNRNIRAMVVLEGFFGTETKAANNINDLGTTNIYFINKDGHEEKIPLDSRHRVNASQKEQNLPDYKKIADGLVTIFNDSNKEKETPKVETGERSILNIFKDGFSLNEAIAGYAKPTVKPAKKSYSRA